VASERLADSARLAVVHVHLEEEERGELLREEVEHGPDHLARPAPRGGEVDDHLDKCESAGRALRVPCFLKDVCSQPSAPGASRPAVVLTASMTAPQQRGDREPASRAAEEGEERTVLPAAAASLSFVFQAASFSIT
jgi:hypothetical protein